MNVTATHGETVGDVQKVLGGSIYHNSKYLIYVFANNQHYDD